ncbi:hypothetical protein AVEN_200479-1 [Araneus ventricosus]|uniref:Uncharacterized protein n=1 Tax=Araneus ventricosus TaxID=182803 RepID=A0A4Y2IDZ9_ARAVE|nr:hypothetical protein AVEN_200479-1 [Araneus ventricosus]
MSGSTLRARNTNLLEPAKTIFLDSDVTSKITLHNNRYREDSSTFEIPYFVAKMVAKVSGPDVAVASHPILIPVKLSSQP